MDGQEEIVMPMKMRYALPILAAFLFGGFVISANAGKPAKLPSVDVVDVEFSFDEL